MNLHGFTVIESEWLTQPGVPVQIRRSWRERLFSRPWRPLVPTRTVTPQVPYEGAYQIGAHTVVMHPAVVRRLRKLVPGR